jgi:hypothetical protein
MWIELTSPHNGKKAAINTDDIRIFCVHPEGHPCSVIWWRGKGQPEEPCFDVKETPAQIQALIRIEEKRLADRQAATLYGVLRGILVEQGKLDPKRQTEPA